MKKNNKIVTIITYIIFFLGISLILYPPLSNLWNSYRQSQAVSEYNEISNNMGLEECEKMFSVAEEYNKSLKSLQFPFSDFDKIKDYDKILNVNGRGMMGYIEIDKLQVKIPIYHGTAKDTLNAFCGHIQGSSLPTGGVGTHSVLSAHRGLPSAKLFTDIDKIEIGDFFKITILNRTLFYSVDQIKTVLPNEINDLLPKQGKDYCTLVTCTPYGLNTHRLLVRGIRTQDLPWGQSENLNKIFKENNLIILLIILLLLLIIIFIVYKRFKGKKLFKKRKKGAGNE